MSIGRSHSFVSGRRGGVLFDSARTGLCKAALLGVAVLMAFASVSSAAKVGQRLNIHTPVGSNWTLRGVGDVNGDGTDDIVWQRNDGQVHYWPMKGGKRTGGINIHTKVGSNWTLRGVGDVNGDGTDDIVWQRNDGQVHYWPMKGGKRTGGINIHTPVSSNWTLRGVGDVNGDGTDDIVWQRNDGQVHYWPMKGGKRTGGINIHTKVGSAWTLHGVGDVTADGTDDIVWQHQNGQTHFWPMKGGQRQGGVNLFDRVGSSWLLRGVGDVNGDRIADIVWQNKNGQVHYWQVLRGTEGGGGASGGGGSTGSTGNSSAAQKITDLGGTRPELDQSSIVPGSLRSSKAEGVEIVNVESGRCFVTTDTGKPNFIPCTTYAGEYWEIVKSGRLSYQIRKGGSRSQCLTVGRSDDRRVETRRCDESDDRMNWVGSGIPSPFGGDPAVMLRPTSHLDRCLAIDGDKAALLPCGRDGSLKNRDGAAIARTKGQFMLREFWLPTDRIRARKRLDKCIHKIGSGSDWRDGQTVHVWDCGAGPAENKDWVYDNVTKVIRSAFHPDKCIVWSGNPSSVSNGTKLVTGSCGDATPNANKQFNYDNDGRLFVTAKTNMCVQKEGNEKFPNGRILHLWDCAAGPRDNKNWDLVVRKRNGRQKLTGRSTLGLLVADGGLLRCVSPVTPAERRTLGAEGGNGASALVTAERCEDFVFEYELDPIEVKASDVMSGSGSDPRGSRLFTTLKSTKNGRCLTAANRSGKRVLTSADCVSTSEWTGGNRERLRPQLFSIMHLPLSEQSLLKGRFQLKLHPVGNRENEGEEPLCLNFDHNPADPNSSAERLFFEPCNAAKKGQVFLSHLKMDRAFYQAFTNHTDATVRYRLSADYYGAPFEYTASVAAGKSVRLPELQPTRLQKVTLDLTDGRGRTTRVFDDQKLNDILIDTPTGERTTPTLCTELNADGTTGRFCPDAGPQNLFGEVFDRADLEPVTRLAQDLNRPRRLIVHSPKPMPTDPAVIPSFSCLSATPLGGLERERARASMPVQISRCHTGRLTLRIADGTGQVGAFRAKYQMVMDYNGQCVTREGTALKTELCRGTFDAEGQKQLWEVMEGGGSGANKRFKFKAVGQNTCIAFGEDDARPTVVACSQGKAALQIKAENDLLTSVSGKPVGNAYGVQVRPVSSSRCLAALVPGSLQPGVPVKQTTCQAGHPEMTWNVITRIPSPGGRIPLYHRLRAQSTGQCLDAVSEGGKRVAKLRPCGRVAEGQRWTPVLSPIDHTYAFKLIDNTRARIQNLCLTASPGGVRDVLGVGVETCRNDDPRQRFRLDGTAMTVASPIPPTPVLFENYLATKKRAIASVEYTYVNNAGFEAKVRDTRRIAARESSSTQKIEARSVVFRIPGNARNDVRLWASSEDAPPGFLAGLDSFDFKLRDPDPNNKPCFGLTGFGSIGLASPVIKRCGTAFNASTLSQWEGLADETGKAVADELASLALGAGEAICRATMDAIEGAGAVSGVVTSVIDEATPSMPFLDDLQGGALGAAAEATLGQLPMELLQSKPSGFRAPDSRQVRDAMCDFERGPERIQAMIRDALPCSQAGQNVGLTDSGATAQAEPEPEQAPEAPSGLEVDATNATASKLLFSSRVEDTQISTGSSRTIKWYGLQCDILEVEFSPKAAPQLFVNASIGASFLINGATCDDSVMLFGGAGNVGLQSAGKGGTTAGAGSCDLVTQDAPEGDEPSGGLNWTLGFENVPVPGRNGRETFTGSIGGSILDGDASPNFSVVPADGGLKIGGSNANKKFSAGVEFSFAP